MKHMLLQVLMTKSTITTDWTAKKYCDITFDWKYSARSEQLFMSWYIHTTLIRFQFPFINTLEHAPQDWKIPTYGSTQRTPLHDSTLLILPKLCTLRI